MGRLQVVVGAAVVTAGALAGYYYLLQRRKKKKPSRVVIAITGFGKFKGVDENPTERFVKEIPDLLKVHPLPPHVVVDRCVAMEVSAEACKEELEVMRSTVFRNMEDCRVYLHLGVASNSSKFKIETSAWNEATFRVADERGWEPASQPIYPEDGKVSTKRRSSLSTGQITRQLQRLQFPVVLSSDPGRFICNYLYYQSLRSCCPTTSPSGTPGQASDTEDFIPEHALFVHVPPTEVIPHEIQMAFLHHLLCIIGDSLCT